MGGINMLTFVIVVGVGWVIFTIFNYIDKLEIDPLIYGIISVLFGILLILYMMDTTIPTIEDYKSGNYKMKITTEIIDGKVISDTTYLKK